MLKPQRRACSNVLSVNRTDLWRSKFFVLLNFFLIFNIWGHSSNFLCSVHGLKLAQLKGAEARGLVESKDDSAPLTEIEWILCCIEARDNRPDTGTISMKPGTNKLVHKARLRSSERFVLTFSKQSMASSL